MNVKRAKTAGFCFGVKRAVETVYEQAKNSDAAPIYTYGPIIHNEEVVKDLENQGVIVLRTEQELEQLTEGTVIIRSHGVAKYIYEKLEKKKRKYSRTDRLILGIGFTILGLFVLSIAIPIIYVVLASFMDPTVLNNQGLSSDIKDWTLDAYRRVLENEMIWRGFLNSFLYSFAFTVISVFVTLLAAFPLSKKEFVGRKFFNLIFLITMFFGGGMIPTFILINQLHMVNTVWAVLIPGAFNVWNMILARTYYQSIPAELREASAIDGANEIQHFFKIMMPVCKPIIAVLALWSFVGMWNSYFDAMIYLNDANLQPLQLVLRSILVQNTPQPGMIADIQSTAEMAKVAEQLKYATIVVSSLPLLVMYPFFQKYFDKGIMVGSVKG